MTQTYRTGRQILDRIDELEDDPDETAELATLREFIGELEGYHDPRHVTFFTEDDAEEMGRDYVNSLEDRLPTLILAHLDLHALGADLMDDLTIFELNEETYYAC